MAKQNESSILQGLDIGSARSVLQSRGGSPLSELLTDLATDVIDQLKVALKTRDINISSMGLSQSIGVTEINLSGGSISIGVSADFYWKYVNYGVNGTEVNHGAPNWGPAPAGEKSFSQAISEWIPQRGLQLPPQFDTFEQFTFAIMANIRKFGQEPRPFFEDVVNPHLADTLREPIEKLIGRSIEVIIASPWQ